MATLLQKQFVVGPHYAEVFDTRNILVNTIIYGEEQLTSYLCRKSHKFVKVYAFRKLIHKQIVEEFVNRFFVLFLSRHIVIST